MSSYQIVMVLRGKKLCCLSLRSALGEQGNPLTMIRIFLLVLVLVPYVSVAASFNCEEAKRGLDKSICRNEKLSALDGYMAEYYFKLKDSLAEDLSSNLLKQQRKWLKKRAIECEIKDISCLVRLYKLRIFDLRKKYENLVPYTFSNSTRMQGIRDNCSFKNENLPDDMIIYAGGAYGGRKINRQIDQSGHQATQFEVIVNSPEQPVALLLGAYEPSIWNIAWTQGTQVKAVVATGYYRQAIAGLPEGIPVLISSYDNRGPCGYLYVAEKNLRKINPLSKRIFGKNVSLVRYASKGNLVFGEQLAKSDHLFTSNDTPPKLFFDMSKPMAGKAGLENLVEKGCLRKVTSEDLDRWANMKAEAHREDLPPVANGAIAGAFRPRFVHNGYVILKKITIPAGLYGGDSATFFLNEGVPYPKGNLGHSTLYDFGTLTCSGVGCGK